MAVARLQQQEVEPLSPKSANIQYKPRIAKQKDAKDMVDEEAKRIEAAKKAAKEKEYAAIPPEWVIQPPVSAGGLAEKYRTGKLLGKGGFAMAYEGELRNKSSQMNQKVFALKVVRAKMSQRKMEEKFRTELQIHAKMKHPNIVEFHRAFTYKDSTYIVLEMCPNGSVMDIVKKRRCLTLPEVRRLTVQLCGAIKYMHARSVIHRDLKMGNLFLDHEMNLKIGDFGLAAVLVSKDEYEGMFDYAKSRRTTLCGTPNYIAPEILEKGRGGHDHKVDIWAIGVILFAMIAGQPPFQSSSQNEIYKRARNVDYAWPEDGKSHNDVPEEAKDLVARLLKVDAEKRPDPDHIVGHSFFSMHGGDAIPMYMEEHFRYDKPQFLDQKARPRGDVMLKGFERLSLRTLAKECGVGYLPGCLAPQATVGADIDLSLYKECAAEEAAGLGPIVPVPKDSVYVSKHSFGVSKAGQVSVEDIKPGKAPKVLKSEGIPHLSNVENKPSKPKTERVRRAPVQSHAATLRAAPFNPKPLQSYVDPQLLELASKPEPKASTIGAARARRGLLNELPVRPVSNTVSANEPARPIVERRPRTTRSKIAPIIDLEGTDQVEKPKPRRPMTKDEYIDATSPDPDKKRSDMAARTRARIASNVQKELTEEPVKARKVSSKSKTIASASTTATSSTSQSLISPNETIEQMPGTKPDEVLRSLRTLHRNLESSLSNLNSRSSILDPKTIEAGKKSFKSRPVVVKWVDYTNKFGIGYILASGTVGCVFKAESSSQNPTCIVVADSETHLKKRKMAAQYAEKHQIIPSAHTSPVEFLENCGDEGLKRVVCQPSQFTVKMSANGVPERLSPGIDIWDYEKRKKLCLWDKFGKYMVQSLGKDADDTADLPNATTAMETKKRSDASSATGSAAGGGPYVKFYQRLGNVGVWGFGDGSFQFNFPDHTKLFIDAEGTWADFYHLPMQAARALSEGRKLEMADLAERSVLSLPVANLLRGVGVGGRASERAGGQMNVEGVEREGLDEVEALDAQMAETLKQNQFELKIAFVRDVVGTWVREGGLGRMGRKKGLQWKGIREESGNGKKVWVTVGARGGDERYEDPGAA